MLYSFYYYSWTGSFLRLMLPSLPAFSLVLVLALAVIAKIGIKIVHPRT
ncbi:MAG: hypothetical protein IH587_04175 [Anaerolineae bacterium]|nr:hypothetical protein [Anaerolineae bacterium]